MSADFAKSPLGDLCVPDGGVQTGPFGSQLHASDYVEYGTPIITVEHLGENRIIHNNLPRVTDEDKERLARYTLTCGDIVFSRVGAVDRRAIVHPEEDGWLFSGRCLRVRPDRKKIDPGFLSWFFGLPTFQEYIRQIAVGATMPSLNTKILRDVPVYYPPSLREQQAIACILGALDDKIELNRRMNRTLEATARALFKSWFVDFDPVHAKATGHQPPGLKPDLAAIFPDAFEDSELGEIPKGWRVGTLGDVAEESRDAVRPAEIDADTPYIALEHIPKRCIALDSWGIADGVASGKLRFSRGDILFGKLRPYFHKVGPAPIDGVCSTDIVVVRPSTDCWYGIVLGHMADDTFVAHTDRGSTGTKMPRTNWRDMAAYPLSVPSADLAKRHTEIVRLLLEKMHAAMMQSRTHAALRDALLPKLISGELAVPDAERIAERCI
ncbi:MAG: restriction endonuclease subunit S [Planctomycetota bacterium]